MAEKVFKRHAMKNCVLFCVLAYRAQYFLRPYSVLSFLVLPFIAWFSLQMLCPSMGSLSLGWIGNYFICGMLLSLLVLIAAIYVTMDCRREIFFMRIDDVVAARALYSLFALGLGLSAGLAGYCLDLAYFALIVFFALRDFHAKRSKFYFLASILLSLICTAASDFDLSVQLVLVAVENWLIQWVMAASVYCVLNCLSSGTQPIGKSMKSSSKKAQLQKKWVDQSLRMNVESF